MTTNYPPQSDRAAAVEQLMSVYGSVIEGREAYYVSAPLTSGRRLLTWYAGNSSEEIDQAARVTQAKSIASSNRSESLPVVRALRREVREPVIDPAAIPDYPGWTQDDYRAFWALVIERHVKTVIFVDGWEYSSGCGFEFLVAQRADVRCLSSFKNELSILDGLELLRQAISDYQAAGIPSGILEPIVLDLERLAQSREARYERIAQA